MTVESVKSRVAWPGGEITSNKNDAKAFLAAKLSKKSWDDLTADQQRFLSSYDKKIDFKLLRCEKKQRKLSASSFIINNKKRFVKTNKKNKTKVVQTRRTSVYYKLHEGLSTQR